MDACVLVLVCVEGRAGVSSCAAEGGTLYFFCPDDDVLLFHISTSIPNSSKVERSYSLCMVRHGRREGLECGSPAKGSSDRCGVRLWRLPFL